MTQIENSDTLIKNEELITYDNFSWGDDLESLLLLSNKEAMHQISEKIKGLNSDDILSMLIYYGDDGKVVRKEIKEQQEGKKIQESSIEFKYFLNEKGVVERYKVSVKDHLSGNCTVEYSSAMIYEYW